MAEIAGKDLLETCLSNNIYPHHSKYSKERSERLTRSEYEGLQEGSADSCLVEGKDQDDEMVDPVEQRKDGSFFFPAVYIEA